MTTLLKAFIAGLVVPSVILPLILCTALHVEKSQILMIPFLHFIPLIWGGWNVIYFLLFKHLSTDVNGRLLITGAALGLIVAIYAVFQLDLPSQLGLPGYMHYVPLVVAPVLYALLWRYAVKPLNTLLGLQS